MLLYKDGVGIKEFKFFHNNKNYHYSDCVEITLNVKKSLFSIDFNKEPKPVSELDGNVIVKYSYGDDSFQENIEIKNAKADKIKDANYKVNLTKQIYSISLIKLYKTQEYLDKPIHNVSLEFRNLDKDLAGNDIIVKSFKCRKD